MRDLFNDIILKKANDRNLNKIAVIGDYNSGKSSFVNSILGDTICPTGGQPVTSCITRFSFSLTEKIEQTGTNEEITKEEYKAIVDRRENKERNAKYEKLPQIDYFGKFQELENSWLYDVPGWSNEEDKEVVKNLINSTVFDAIFVIIDINQTLTESIKNLSDKIQADTKILILNKADTKSPSGIGRILKDTNGDGFNEVLPYSAEYYKEKFKKCHEKAINIIKNVPKKRISVDEQEDDSEILIYENCELNELITLRKRKLTLTGKNDGKDKPAIKIKSGAKIIIDSSDITFKNIHFYFEDYNNNCIFYSQESRLKIINCFLSKISISVTNTRLDIEDSDIYENTSTAVFAEKNSIVKLVKSSIYRNKGNGLNIISGSTLFAEGSNIYQNGNEGITYPQIYIVSSTAEINTTRIYDSLGGGGLYGIDNSTISLKAAEVFKNKAYGIYLKGASNLSIEGSDIYANGTEGKSYPQIYIESSKADIANNTKIRDSLGGTSIHGLDNSTISLKAAKVFKNKGHGIYLKGASNLSIEGSDIYANGTEGKTYYQIYIVSSKADIANTKIHDSLGGTGIYGKDKSAVSLKATAVFKNKYNGIDLNSSNLSIENSSITENGTYGKYYQQIYLGFSTANIKNSKVGNGFGASSSIGVEEHSNLTLEGSEVDILYCDSRSKRNVKNDCNIAKLYSSFGVFTINNDSKYIFMLRKKGKL